MKAKTLLYAGLLLITVRVAHADGRRDLNDCMLGEYQASIQACTRLLDKGGGGTNLASLYTLRGYAKAQLGKNQEAVDDLSKAIGMAPKANDAYSFRSAIYHAMGRDDLAAADLDQSNKLMKEPPRDAIQKYCEGLYLLSMGGTELAVFSFDEAIRTDPSMAAAYAMRGQAQGMSGAPDKAVAGAEKAIQLDPQYSAAYMGRGQAHLHQKQFDMALADFNQAIALNPQYVSSFYSRGVVYAMKNDKDHAAADFRQALVFNPNHQPSRDGLKKMGVAP